MANPLRKEFDDLEAAAIDARINQKVGGGGIRATGGVSPTAVDGVDSMRRHATEIAVLRGLGALRALAAPVLAVASVAALVEVQLDLNNKRLASQRQDRGLDYQPDSVGTRMPFLLPGGQGLSFEMAAAIAKDEAGAFMSALWWTVGRSVEEMSTNPIRDFWVVVSQNRSVRAHKGMSDALKSMRGAFVRELDGDASEIRAWRHRLGGVGG